VVRGLGYAAILKNNQLSPSRAVENLGKVFWVPGFEIASCVICRFPLVPEGPHHAIDNDVEAFGAKPTERTPPRELDPFLSAHVRHGLT
jgi:hypothetical protein